MSGTDTSTAAVKERPVNGTPRRVCFVCTGNTCRSPMAAAILNHLMAKDAEAARTWLGAQDPPPPVALSAGLAAIEGAPITSHAADALAQAGIPSTPTNDYLHHTAHMADASLLASCDLIVGISRRHAMELIFRYPELADRITAMPRDIPDPFGGDLTTYAACLSALCEGIRALFFPEGD